MIDPVYYVINGFKKTFEKLAIFKWKAKNPICPTTKENILDISIFYHTEINQKIKQLIIDNLEKNEHHSKS